MSKTYWCATFLLVSVLTFAGCGTPSSNSGAGQGGSSAADSDGESGEAVAEEILATFDEMAAAAMELAQDKPDGAELREKLESLYADYEKKMADLNARYLKLQDNPREFGNANSYLGTNRGPRITARDHKMTPLMQYYNLEIGDRETVEMLTSGMVQVLEIAVKR